MEVLCVELRDLPSGHHHSGEHNLYKAMVVTIANTNLAIKMRPISVQILETTESTA